MNTNAIQKGRVPVLYTRNKPHKRKPNWRNILLTALCVVLLASSVTLLVKSIPAWTDRGDDTQLSSSPTPPAETLSPSQTPAASPDPTASPEAEETAEPSPTPQRGSGVQTITIGAVGDIAMHAHELQAAKSGDGYDFTAFFSRVQPYLSWQDAVIGNLETTIAQDKFDATRSPAQLLDGLKAAGVDVLTLANEHILDADIAGAQATVGAVKDAGLTPVGAYTSGADYIAPVILTKDDLRIAVLNYTETTDNTPEGASDTVKYLTEAAFDNDMKQVQADETGIDFVIVCVHWGTEDDKALTDSQKAWAQTFADAGVDAVLGTGTHYLQELTYVQGASGKRTLVAYGLGNFLSGARTDGRDAGAILSFTLKKDFDSGETAIEDVTYAPTWVLKYSSEGKYSFEIMSAVEYSQKKYQNMSLTDRDRIKKVQAEVEAALGTGAGKVDTSIRTMTDGVSTVVQPEE